MAAPKESLPPIPRSVVHNTLVRVLMLLVFGFSVWLAWRSVDRLPPVQRSLQTKDSERARLANDVQQLEMQWNAGEAERTEERFKEAGELLFAGPEERDRWQQEIKRHGVAMGFDAIVRLDNTQPPPQTEHKLSVQRLTLDLAAVPFGRSTNSPYQRLLGFARTLENAKRRVDVIELSVVGASNSIHHARAVLELWARQEEPKEPNR
jgi:hypothetical protein